MNREEALRRRLRALGTLNEAVTAMKSLSAHHFRMAREALPAARAYRAEVEGALQYVALPAPGSFEGPPGMLVVTSNLGLCGDYNVRLARAAVEEYPRRNISAVYCLGTRSRNTLSRAGVTLRKVYTAPTSVSGIPDTLLQVAQDLLEDFGQGAIGSLYALSARFEGAGRFTPVCVRLLPIESPPREAALRPLRYATTAHLAAVTGREHLYTGIHETLLDALASEHGMRLTAAEAARHWLDQTTETTRRQLIAGRRETATQEVLDILAGSRAMRRRSEDPRQAM